MNMQIQTIMIADAVCSDLAMRQSAAIFFDVVERNRSMTVVVDFSGVKSISRSFAHEYLLRKGASVIRITEKNVPRNVEEMFAVVRAPARKERMIHQQVVQPIEI